MSEKKLLKNDVIKILELLSKNEDGIFEYSAESELGKQLQTVLKDFQSKLVYKELEIEELKNQLKKEPIVILPNSDAIRLHGNMMYTESVILALDKAGVKYEW